LFCCISEGHVPATLYLKDGKEDGITAFWRETYALEVEPLDPLCEYSFFPAARPVGPVREILHSLLSHAIVGESDFPVAALLQTDIGYISGVNIELKPWNCGLCAERTAI